MFRCGGLRCRLGGGLVGEAEEGLAGDPQVVELLVEFTQPHGQCLDAGPGLFGLAGQVPLACVDTAQEAPQLGIFGRAARQAGVTVPVSRRTITAVIAQHTLDCELSGRYSYSPTRLRDGLVCRSEL